MIPSDFLLGLAGGLAIAAVLYLVLWWRAQRGRSLDLPAPYWAPWPASSSEAPDGDGHAAALDTTMRLAPSPISGESAAPSFLPFPGLVPTPDLASGPAAAIWRELPNGNPPRPSFPRETLRLSQRVILHVYAQGDLPPGAVAPPGLCQAGMVEALGIPQAGLAAVLRRLEAAGMFQTERGHVRGRDRRLKVYRLSSRGVELAQELRHRRSSSGSARSSTRSEISRSKN